MYILRESCSYKEKHMRICTNIAKQLYYFVQWVGKYDCCEDFYVERNNFKSYLILYTTDGRGTLHYKGKTYNIDKNTIMFLDCQEHQQYYTQVSPWNFKYIHFCGNMSTQYYEYITKLYGGPVLHCSSADTDRLIDDIINSVKKPESEATCSKKIYKLLISIINNHNFQGSYFKFEQITKYISENFSKPIDINTIADKFHYSRSYFSTKFKEQCGISPAGYLKQCRINAAVYFLTNTDYAIENIAYRCGFNCSSAFIRAFKAETGYTPYTYRKERLQLVKN